MSEKGNHPGRHRRLGIPALARHILPEGAEAGRGVELRQPTSDAIEINGTFYGLQKPASYQKWRAGTPMISSSRSRARAL